MKFSVVRIDYCTEFILFYAEYIKANFGFHARARAHVRVGARVRRVTLPNLAPVGEPC